MRSTDTPNRSSRLSGFYQKSVAERTAIVAQWAELTSAEVAVLYDGLTVAQADQLVENVVGRYSLPLSIGANFIVNHRDVLVPMVVEEPSVVAAVSYAAKLARSGGGFRTGSTEPIMIAQIQLLGVRDAEQAQASILAARPELLAAANTSPSIAARGGGPVDIETHFLAETPTEPMLIVHLLFDTCDAMGANAVNTAAEAIAPMVEQLSGGKALLRILSNLTDRRRAWAEVTIPAAAFSSIESSGNEIIAGIAHANAFAVADPYRAATHNKGILNGIDAVTIATGNDWRAIEAGAHAYAARNGRYQALTDWRVITEFDSAPGESEGVTQPIGRAALFGRLELPLAVGIVGGTTRAHPVAQVALKILGVQRARELSEIMAAVGLAQNLAAIRALATEGIQRGHMALHARQVAIAAGATGSDVERFAGQMAAEGQIRVERAKELLSET